MAILVSVRYASGPLLEDPPEYCIDAVIVQCQLESHG